MRSWKVSSTFAVNKFTSNLIGRIIISDFFPHNLLEKYISIKINYKSNASAKRFDILFVYNRLSY